VVVRINSWYHAKSTAKKYGGQWTDYIDLHEFIDSSKHIIGDVRHRSLYHHTEGVWLCQKIFGHTIINSNNKEVPVRLIAELHIIQDLGWLPSPKDYIDGMVLKVWMGGHQTREEPIEKLLGVKSNNA
jgi:hypothetical protein